MYVGSDYSPSDNPESEVYELDFVNDLATGDSISSAVWVCANASDSQVQDATPSARIIAGPFVTSATKTSVRVSGLQTGVKYTLQANVTTTFGNNLTLFSHVPCEAIF